MITFSFAAKAKENVGMLDQGGHFSEGHPPKGQSNGLAWQGQKLQHEP